MACTLPAQDLSSHSTSYCLATQLWLHNTGGGCWEGFGGQRKGNSWLLTGSMQRSAATLSPPLMIEGSEDKGPSHQQHLMNEPPSEAHCWYLCLFVGLVWNSIGTRNPCWEEVEMSQCQVPLLWWMCGQTGSGRGPAMVKMQGFGMSSGWHRYSRCLRRPSTWSKCDW